MYFYKAAMVMLSTPTVLQLSLAFAVTILTLVAGILTSNHMLIQIIIYFHSFYPSTLSLWNSLTQFIVSSPSLLFKRNLRI